MARGLPRVENLKEASLGPVVSFSMKSTKRVVGQINVVQRKRFDKHLKVKCLSVKWFSAKRQGAKASFKKTKSLKMLKWFKKNHLKAKP
jgi:hypothetical protein